MMDFLEQSFPDIDIAIAHGKVVLSPLSFHSLTYIFMWWSCGLNSF